ncbi:Na+/H+ antiporter subunit E [Microbacterium marinilacus]|uniref:Na+/H+ antiporter subunit E n=1 Tax=Microbacterium marinilacus TaxID=415209 RepID=A0ABP7BWX8_9MICO|nr:Na+/H+ antiporter subunit E [Microbacterium marinilacus]MBY0688212.1 Na+/H+ antiporter subunit E [Microbacterium marinilacus]
MSPTFRHEAHRFWNQLPFFVWLVLLWMMLWGQFTVLAALTGIAIAVFVTKVFHLPTAELSGRLNLWYGLLFIVLFLFEVVRGAITVAWQVVRPKETTAGIIAVPLRTDADLIMTHVAVTSSLIPGSLIVEADRERRILYLHVLGVSDREDAEAQRRHILLWEERIVRAVGSRADLEAVRAASKEVDA